MKFFGFASSRYNSVFDPIPGRSDRIGQVLERPAAYLPSFQISAASFQSFPTFSQTTTYFPVTSCGVGPLVFKLKVPISRAAEGWSGLTSRVTTFGSLTCSAMLFHIAPMAVPPCTIAEPGGNAVASVVTRPKIRHSETAASRLRPCCEWWRERLRRWCEARASFQYEARLPKNKLAGVATN